MQTPNVRFDSAPTKTTTGKFETIRGTADGIQLFFPADVILQQSDTLTDGTATNASSEAVAAYSASPSYPGTRVVKIDNKDAAVAIRVGIGITPTATKGDRIPAQQSATYRTDLAVNVISEGANVSYARNVYTLN